MQEIVFHPSVQEILKVLHPKIGEALVSTVMDAAKGRPVGAHLADEIAPDAIELVYPIFGALQLSAFYANYRKKPVVFFAHHTSTPGLHDETIIDTAQNALNECMLIIDAMLDKKD